MALTNECLVVYDPGEDITGHCEAAVTGKRFVKVSDPKQSGSLGLSANSLGGNVVVSPCTSGARALGVAAYDAAIATKVPVMRGRKVVVMTAGAAVTAGDSIMSDGTGRVITYVPGNAPAEGQPLVEVYSAGQALSSAANAGDDIVVALDL